MTCMEVETIQRSKDPERLVCKAARGDYYDGFIGDTRYKDLMWGVQHDDSHLEGLADILHREGSSIHDYVSYAIEDYFEGEPIDEEILLLAKQRAFIEKQLSRGHYGPWEHPSISFAVKGVSRVTMAQITRHRHMSFDVQSMRYVDFSEQEIVTPRSLTDDDHFTREGGETQIPEREDARMMYEETTEHLVEIYRELVEDNNVPKEDARYVLPLGMSVNMTLSGNARTMMHLMDMRRKADAQWEVRELSELLVDELREWMPMTFNHYEQQLSKLAP